MKSSVKFILQSGVLGETIEALRVYGSQGCEGLVLWLGRTNSDETCLVETAFLPPQNSIKSEDGVGYFVTSETLLALNRLLAETGLRLLAQVHSHPGRAYHSAADDQYCIVTVEGGLSLVVPDFGFGPADLSEWSIYRLKKSRWVRLSGGEVKSMFELRDKQEGGILSF